MGNTRTHLSKRWREPVTGTRRWDVVERTEATIVDQLLKNRGIEDRERFFSPDFERDSHDPFLMPNMSSAIARIEQAIESKETVAVFCDYDADGIPGGALLVKVLRANGLTVVPYVPDREKEGYGINALALEQLKSKQVTLVITVDLGVTNKEQVKVAKELGLDVIITDHHHVDPDRLPADAVAIVHPALQGSQYPFAGLAGGGVAWKLAQALSSRTQIPDVKQLKWWFELPAISTVCDIVPLLDENRMIVHYGLKVLAQTRNEGLKALYKAGGITPDNLTEWTIGFQIGPRLNAPSRVDHASRSLNLLLEDDPTQAARAAAIIETQNQERQAQLESMVEEAVAMVEAEKLAEQPAIVLFAPHWTSGLIGLGASRIMERYHRPTILLGEHEGGLAKGSGRSIDGFSLLEAIDAQKKILETYGGHTKAAGLGLKLERVDEFRTRFIAFAQERLSTEDLAPRLKADLQITPGEITEELVTDLLRFSPCGMGNPTPKFVVTPLTIVDLRAVGATGAHLKLRFQEGPENGLEAIGFGLGERASSLKVGDRVEALGALEFNSYNGIERIQLKLSDLRLVVR